VLYVGDTYAMRSDAIDFNWCPMRKEWLISEAAVDPATVDGIEHTADSGSDYHSGAE